jgi:hypothetical protein
MPQTRVITRPSAAVRLTITTDMLDDGGILLTREAVRHITGELFDVPADIRFASQPNSGALHKPRLTNSTIESRPY